MAQSSPIMTRTVRRQPLSSRLKGVAGLLLAGGGTTLAPHAAAELDPVLFAQLQERARHHASEPYVPADTTLPEALQTLDYDGHRDIRCPPASFLWADSDRPFRLQFKHRGWLFGDEVKLFTAEPDTARVAPLPFKPGRFTYGPLALEKLDPAALPEGLGYAGLSLHRVGPVDRDGQETYNEIMSFQGGCYFRAVGHGQHWGASVRAVAIDTALAHPEEFPRWAELWAQPPAPGDPTVTLYGLMDGPSVAGAYAMVVTPGTPDRPTLSVDVTSRLYFRKPVEKLGLAPITSMFLFGEATPARHGDYRPEVHDSDGLVLQHADGSLDWRPLRNPPHLAVSRFKMTDPRGFGLVQRDRNFNHYEDLETEMQIRPSVWVTPRHFHQAASADADAAPVAHTGRKPWGDGWVELLEIASDDEGIDNIGAYWVPAHADELGAGSVVDLSYRLDFTREARPENRGGVIPWASTRTVLGDGSADSNAQSLVRTVVLDDADGRPVGRFLIDSAPDTALPSGTIVRADVSIGRGELVKQPTIQYNRFTHSYRLFFDVRAEGQEPVELRATLRGDAGQALSETWLYRWDQP
ncbi:MAG: glucan biosynthesis protein [Planctomycetota bacterium]